MSVINPLYIHKNRFNFIKKKICASELDKLILFFYIHIYFYIIYFVMLRLCVYVILRIYKYVCM